MKRILTALGIGMAGITGTVSADEGRYGKYESPRYEVVRQIGGAELRTYAPQLLAVVAVEGDRSSAMSRGFRVLAGYIFGGNSGSAQVAMTSPVTQRSIEIDMTAPVTQSGSDDIWEVTFMMPSEFQRSTLPRPNNAAIRFVDVPERQMIVLTFSGRTPARVLDSKVAELAQILEASSHRAVGDPIFMFYDDPFTLPMNRRNEVGFVVQ
ncbi:MAG: heme-binding protein [Pseudomonadota bacterium]